MAVLCFRAKWAAIRRCKENGVGQLTKRREAKFPALSNNVPSARGIAKKFTKDRRSLPPTTKSCAERRAGRT